MVPGLVFFFFPFVIFKKSIPSRILHYGTIYKRKDHFITTSTICCFRHISFYFLFYTYCIRISEQDEDVENIKGIPF